MTFEKREKKIGGLVLFHRNGGWERFELNKLGRFGSSAGQKFLWALQGDPEGQKHILGAAWLVRTGPGQGLDPEVSLEIRLTAGEEVGRGFLHSGKEVGTGFLHSGEAGRVFHAQVGTKASPCSRCCSAFEDLASLAGSLAAAWFAQHLLSPG